MNDPVSSVWLVTSGEYSDFHVVAVFATKELADAYAKHSPGSYGHGEAEVEEWPLRAELPALHEWLSLVTVIDVDGTVLGEKETTSQAWADEKIPVAASPSIHPDQAVTWRPPPLNEEASVRVWTDGVDHERTRKVHAEALAVARVNAPILLAPRPDAEGEYPAPVNYRLGHELTRSLQESGGDR